MPTMTPEELRRYLERLAQGPHYPEGERLNNYEEIDVDLEDDLDDMVRDPDEGDR